MGIRGSMHCDKSQHLVFIHPNRLAGRQVIRHDDAGLIGRIVRLAASLQVTDNALRDIPDILRHALLKYSSSISCEHLGEVVSRHGHRVLRVHQLTLYHAPESASRKSSSSIII